MAGSFFKSSFCCCGCSLKEGTLALLYITMFFWGIVIIAFFHDQSPGDDSSIPLMAFCLILCKIAGIYGINEKIPALLIPQMVTQVIFMVVWGFFALSLIFLRQHKLSTIENDVIEKFKYLFRFPHLVIVTMILFGIQYHLFTVVFGYYSQMKKQRIVPVQVQMTAVKYVNQQPKGLSIHMVQSGSYLPPTLSGPYLPPVQSGPYISTVQSALYLPPMQNF